MSELLYHGTKMVWQPVNCTSETEVLNTLFRPYGSVYVVLEPGDATRYELLLGHVSGGITVVRTTGGDPVGGIGTIYSHSNGDDIKNMIEHGLKIKNAWTVYLLIWWFQELLRLYDEW